MEHPPLPWRGRHLYLHHFERVSINPLTPHPQKTRVDFTDLTGHLEKPVWTKSFLLKFNLPLVPSSLRRKYFLPWINLIIFAMVPFSLELLKNSFFSLFCSQLLTNLSALFWTPSHLNLIIWNCTLLKLKLCQFKPRWRVHFTYFSYQGQLNVQPSVLFPFFQQNDTVD